MTALGISFATGPTIIRWLRAKKAKTVRIDTPLHHQSKAGTPDDGRDYYLSVPWWGPR